MNVNNYLQQFNVADRPLNILTVTAHERYQTGLAATGHNFYAINQPGLKKWFKTFAKMPPNHIELCDSTDLKSALESIPPYLNIDLVLSHHKFGSYQILRQISEVFGVSMISLEHTLPLMFEQNGQKFGWSTDQLLQMREMRGDVDVFISDYNKYGWLFEDGPTTLVIEHGIDTNLFFSDTRERKTEVLSVVNDFINRDVFCGYKLWEKIVSGLPHRVLGTTPGLSEPAKNEGALAEAYRDHRVFLNTSQISPIPSVVLEAMASEMAVISSATCLIPTIIENGVNGFLSNDPEELHYYVDLCQKDQALSERLGHAARQTILERFSMNRFVKDWDNLFRSLT